MKPFPYISALLSQLVELPRAKRGDRAVRSKASLRTEKANTAALRSAYN